MAGHFIHLTCNHCHTDLDMDPDKLMMFCPFCGEKLMIDIGQLQEILAGLKKAEQEQPANPPEEKQKSQPKTDHKDPGTYGKKEQVRGENKPEDKYRQKTNKVEDEDKLTEDGYPIWYDPPIEDHRHWYNACLWIVPFLLVIAMITVARLS